MGAKPLPRPSRRPDAAAMHALSSLPSRRLSCRSSWPATTSEAAAARRRDAPLPPPRATVRAANPQKAAAAVAAPRPRLRGRARWQLARLPRPRPADLPCKEPKARLAQAAPGRRAGGTIKHSREVGRRVHAALRMLHIGAVVMKAQGDIWSRQAGTVLSSRVLAATSGSRLERRCAPPDCRCVQAGEGAHHA